MSALPAASKVQPHDTSTSASLSFEAPPQIADLNAEILAPRSQRLWKFEMGTGVSGWALSSLAQVAGQSTLLHAASMFLASTMFFFSGMERREKGPPVNYQAQTAASFVWMASSLPLFKQHQKMKWVGVTSWSGMVLFTSYGAVELARMMSQ
jgi:hypothetical protein